MPQIFVVRLEGGNLIVGNREELESGIDRRVKRGELVVAQIKIVQVGVARKVKVTEIVAGKTQLDESGSIRPYNIVLRQSGILHAEQCKFVQF